MAKGFFGGGTGALSDPYLIEDAYDLYAIRFNLTKHFKLVDNINIDVPPFDKTGWTPIPGMFSGTFNGNEKKIFNLVINAETKDDVGLFSSINSNYFEVGSIWLKNVYNLSIENAKVNGRNNVGILAGRIWSRPNNAESDDVAYLTLEKVHVSGTVNGLNNVGGMVGFIDCYTSTYVWRFAEDCIADVKLYLQAEVAQAGLLFGTINSSLSTSAPLKFVDCIAKGYIANTATAQKAYSIVCAGANSLNLNVTSCIYDSTLWNGKATTGSVGKTTAKMMLKEEFPNLELKKSSAGNSSWIFGYQKYPKLWFMELNSFFVIINNKYCVYDAVNKRWVEKYNRVPTKAEAVRDGMKSLDDINRAAWDSLELMSPIADIVNIVDKSVGFTFKDYLLTLNRDASKDMPSKQVYRKEIILSNYDHSIFKFENV
jgi:hypothetical protein